MVQNSLGSSLWLIFRFICLTVIICFVNFLRFFILLRTFTFIEDQVSIGQHNILLDSIQFNVRSLIFSQQVFIKSFSSRLKALKNTLELKSFSFSLSDLKSNSEEVFRIILFLKFFSPLLKRKSFILKKRLGLSVSLKSFDLYDACFFNLLFISYQPFWEAKKDPFNFNFESELLGNDNSFLLNNYLRNLSFLYPEISIVSFFDFHLIFNLKNVNWLLKNFPFDNFVLKLYLYDFVLGNRIYSASSALFFDYNKFNLFLFNFVTNGLLCF